jgi:hypothetical protein
VFQLIAPGGRGLGAWSHGGTRHCPAKTRSDRHEKVEFLGSIKQGTNKAIFVVRGYDNVHAGIDDHAAYYLRRAINIIGMPDLIWTV